MQSNKGRDTRPEVRVRSALHRSGLRFRKHVRPLRGLSCSADVVFPTERVAVFIDGCYWHSCPDHRGELPKTNREWWDAKLAKTQERDRANTSALEAEGWIVLRAWEHENVADVTAAVASAVRGRRAARIASS